MKKTFIIILISIISGFLFTYYLNKKPFYAKEEYKLYAFQIGAFENYDNALNFSQKIPSIIIEESNLYKVYSGIYKNLDVLNKMLVYFENNGIKVYIKNIEVNKYFYKEIDNYENIILNSNDYKVYEKLNESILNLYKEAKNEKNI